MSYSDFIKYNKNQALLNNKFFSLPTNWDNHDCFITFIRSNQKTYISLANQITYSNNEKTLSSKYSDLFENLIRVIESHLKGDYATSYETIDKILKISYKDLINIDDSSGLSGLGTRQLYRARVRRGNNNINIFKDMFHIPFEAKEKIMSYRFSAQGHPCLYLCDNSFTCWKELSEPDIDKFYVSEFVYNRNSLKLFDFTWDSIDYSNNLNRQLVTKEKPIDIVNSNLIKYILLWPIMFFCSIKVKDYNKNLMPEYIVPQLLLKWITKNEFADGVKYLSTKVNEIKESSQKVNYAIPAKIIADTGYCKHLSNIFTITDPVTIDNLTKNQPELSNIIIDDNEFYREEYQTRFISFDIYFNREMNKYKNTIFGKLEYFLKQQDLKKISNH